MSDVSGGQVAIGGRVFQIDAEQGAHVVINAEADVTITRRPAPVMRPAPPFPGLVGRSKEMAAIRKALSERRSVEVVGPSGIGKTALLRASSNTALPATTPDGVIAVPAQLSVPDSLNYVFDACYEGSRRVVPRRAELTEALAELRLLLVIDDPGLNRDQIDLLRQSLPASLFLFAAHEQRVFAEVDGVMLSGLDDESGVALIEGAVGRPLSERERSVGVQVTQVLRGTPIELVRFAGLVRTDEDGDLVSVARGFGVDARPEDVLVAVQRATSPEEDAVLAVLAAVGAPVGAGPVAAMSGQPDAGELLVRLAERGLVAGDDLQGWRPRVASAASVEDRHLAAVMLADWMRRRVLPEEVAAEIPAIAAALRSAAQDRRHADAIAVAAAAERPLALAGRWAAWQETLQAGLGAATAAEDVASQRYFRHQLSVVKDAMGSTGATLPTQAGGVAAQPATGPSGVGVGAQGHPPVGTGGPGGGSPPSGPSGPRPPLGTNGPGGAPPAVPKPWWKKPWGIAALVAALVIGLPVVMVVAAALLDGGGGGGGGGDVEPVTVTLDFGEVPLGSEAVETIDLQLPPVELPLEPRGGDDSFRFFFADSCGLAEVCTVEAVFGPIQPGPVEGSAQLVDAAGTLVAEVTVLGFGVDTGGDGNGQAQGAPNLVAFTLAEENGILRLGAEEPRTIRVWNQEGDGVADAAGGLMSARVDGPAVLLDPQLPGCTLLSDREMECEVGPLPVGGTVDFRAILLARDVGEVALTMTATDSESLVSRDQVWVYGVDPGADRRAACTSTVPDVRGLLLDEAAAVLADADLLVDPFVVEDGQASGLVLEQEPPPGTDLDCGSVVQVLFSGLS